MIYGFENCKIIPHSPDGTLLVVDGSGVIYGVSVPTTFMQEAPESLSRIYIYHHQTERGQTLYGFNCLEDKALFLDLISVDGFGPSGALKLMSSFTPAKIRIVIGDEDVQELSKAKGLGKKTGDKIVLKLCEKYKEFNSVEGSDKEQTRFLGKEIELIAVKSLVKLGYASRESREKVRDAMLAVLPVSDKPPDITTESTHELVATVVRHALSLT